MVEFRKVHVWCPKQLDMHGKVTSEFEDVVDLDESLWGSEEGLL